MGKSSRTNALVGEKIAILDSLFFLLWCRCPNCGRFLGRTWDNYCSC